MTNLERQAETWADEQQAGPHQSREVWHYRKAAFLAGARAALDAAASEADTRHVHMDGVDSCQWCQCSRHIQQRIRALLPSPEQPAEEKV